MSVCSRHIMSLFPETNEGQYLPSITLSPSPRAQFSQLPKPRGVFKFERGPEEKDEGVQGNAINSLFKSGC